MSSFFPYVWDLGSKAAPAQNAEKFVCALIRSITMIYIIEISLFICPPHVTRQTKGSRDVGPQLDVARNSYIWLCIRRPCAPKVRQVTLPGCMLSSMTSQERPIHSGGRTDALQVGWDRRFLCSCLTWDQCSPLVKCRSSSVFLSPTVPPSIPHKGHPGPNHQH